MLKSITVCQVAQMFLKGMDIHTALEIGSGGGGILAQFDIPCKIGVDQWEPSLLESVRDYPSVIPLKYDISKLNEILLPKSFDLVIGFDILEHFEEWQIPALICMAEAYAKKAVIFWGPLESEPSENLFPENAGNEHRSVLTPEMFTVRGYETLLFPNYWVDRFRVDNTVCGLLAFKVIA